MTNTTRSRARAAKSACSTDGVSHPSTQAQGSPASGMVAPGACHSAAAPTLSSAGAPPSAARRRRGALAERSLSPGSRSGNSATTPRPAPSTAHQQAAGAQKSAYDTISDFPSSPISGDASAAGNASTGLPRSLAPPAHESHAPQPPSSPPRGSPPDASSRGGSALPSFAAALGIGSSVPPSTPFARRLVA